MTISPLSGSATHLTWRDPNHLATPPSTRVPSLMDQTVDGRPRRQDAFTLAFARTTCRDPHHQSGRSDPARSPAGDHNLRTCDERSGSPASTRLRLHRNT